ncbi:cell envelope integrity protein TolA [Anaplasma phagocytophilum]|uniref:cell envelope integrity protein TolA n=1 Tax=Anaplasma phagocytophilum TaxID=948 RepID=UPI00201A2936
MLSVRGGIRRALGKNIHIISSLLVHLVMGVFLIVRTSSPESYRVSTASCCPNSSDIAIKSQLQTKGVDYVAPSESQVATLVNSTEDIQRAGLYAKPGIQPPSQSSKKPARMSLARSDITVNTLASQEELMVVQPVYEYEQQPGARYTNPHKKGLFGYSKSIFQNVLKNHVPEEVVDSLSEQFAKCWTMPAGIDDDNSAVVKIKLALDPSGKVTAATISDTNLYDHDPLYRALADSALRAVHKCNPITELRGTDYSIWNEIVLTFNPQQIS